LRITANCVPSSHKKYVRERMKVGTDIGATSFTIVKYPMHLMRLIFKGLLRRTSCVVKKQGSQYDYMKDQGGAEAIWIT
jgi:hypothetical protein